MYVRTFLTHHPNLNFHSTVQNDFVQTVRAVEDIIGIGSEPDFKPAGNMTAVFEEAAGAGDYSDEVKSVLKDTIPVLFRMAVEYGGSDMFLAFPRNGKDALTTKCVYFFPT